MNQDLGHLLNTHLALLGTCVCQWLVGWWKAHVILIWTLLQTKVLGLLDFSNLCQADLDLGLGLTLCLPNFFLLRLRCLDVGHHSGILDILIGLLIKVTIPLESLHLTQTLNYHIYLLLFTLSAAKSKFDKIFYKSGPKKNVFIKNWQSVRHEKLLVSKTKQSVNES